MRININTDAAVIFTNKLEKLSKIALPNAVRGALNKAVYDVKTNTMPTKANATFVNRQKNFFKANSRFENATGQKISLMKSTVGFVSNTLKGTHNFAIKDLEQQEQSGVIRGRSFIALRGARVGQSDKGLVRAANRIGNVKNLIRAGKMRGKNKGQKFIKAVVKAGKGGFVLGVNQIVFKITSLNKKGEKFKAIALYKYKKRGTVKINKASHFMQKASLETGKKIESFFIAEAQRQILKYTK